MDDWRKRKQKESCDTYICGLLDKGGVFKIDVQKQLLIKKLREYLDRAEKDDTTYCELLMEIPELLETFELAMYLIVA